MKKNLIEIVLYLWVIGIGLAAQSHHWLAWIGLAALVWKAVRMYRGADHGDAFKASQFKSTQFKSTQFGESKSAKRKNRK